MLIELTRGKHAVSIDICITSLPRSLPSKQAKSDNSRVGCRKIFCPNTCHWIPMPSPKFSKITLTIPTEQRDWLKDHPEIDISKLLQQAISNQMMKNARKVQHSAPRFQRWPKIAGGMCGRSISVVASPHFLHRHPSTNLFTDVD